MANTDKARIDFLERSAPHLDDSCQDVDPKAFAYLDCDFGIFRAKNIRAAIDMAMKAERRRGKK